MSANKKIVTVFGATGLQGSSVVNALLKDGKWTIRCVTRRPEDDKAKKLAARGCQVVKCDMVSDTVQMLTEMLKGSYGAFLMTNFWDPQSMGKEESLGKKLVDACKNAGVRHCIWSTLPNVETLSKGKYNVPHFTDKAKVEEYMRSLQAKTPKAFEWVTFTAPSFYYQNFQTFFPPKMEGDTLVFTLPKIKNLTGCDVDETGAGCVTAFNNPSKWDLKRIDYYGEDAPVSEYIKTYAKITGKKCKLNEPTCEEYSKFGFPGSEEMGAMFGWVNEYGMYGPTGDRKSGIEATPGGLCSWEQWVRKTNAGK